MCWVGGGCVPPLVERCNSTRATLVCVRACVRACGAHTCLELHALAQFATFILTFIMLVGWVVMQVHVCVCVCARARASWSS